MLDLILRGGRLIDGSGTPWCRADVGIKGEKIADIGALGPADAKRVIEVDGLFVTPGFVDMHSHSDLPILNDPELKPKVFQGVTLEVLGQDGIGVAPLVDERILLVQATFDSWSEQDWPSEPDWRSVGEFLDRVDGRSAVNVAYLVPHGTIRIAAMGVDDRRPSAQELRRMEDLLAQGMEDGAVGLSTGLGYVPCMYAEKAELEALCRVVSRYGGFFAPHHRSYGLGALEAYDECIEIAGTTQTPLHLTHATLLFDINRGRARELLDRVDRARVSGVDVTLDSYPYVAAAGSLGALLPRWVQDGGPSAAESRIRAVALTDRIQRHMEVIGTEGFQGMPVDWSVVVVSGAKCEDHQPWIGKSIKDIASMSHRTPFDCYVDLITKSGLGTPYVEFTADEENVRLIMQHPAHMAGSDGALGGEQPHPRGWGTFPRYLGRYVRELGVLSWEDAIRKMTALPTQRLGFWDRGLLRVGMAADVVCFDPLTVKDAATFEAPTHFPHGIQFVIVNGRVVVDGGQHTGILSGRALRRRCRSE